MKSILFSALTATLMMPKSSPVQNDNGKYYELISSADVSSFHRDYSGSLSFFKTAFLEFPKCVKDRERVRALRASVFAEDISFAKDQVGILLSRATSVDADTYYELKKISEDSSESSLENITGWKDLIHVYNDSVIQSGPKYMTALSDKLDALFDDDQTVRLRIDSLLKTSGKASHQTEIDSLASLAMNRDALQSVFVAEIIDSLGWLPIGVINAKANATLFLAIQHADEKPHLQERMLPILKAAAEEGKTRSQYYAMLADRVQFRKSGQQKYGSQVFYDKDHNPMPKTLEDTNHLNRLRASMGMVPMEAYLQAIRQN